MGNLPEVLSQAILVGIIFVGRLAVALTASKRAGGTAPARADRAALQRHVLRRPVARNKSLNASRLARVVLARGPRRSSLHRSKFNGQSPRGIDGAFYTTSCCVTPHLARHSTVSCMLLGVVRCASCNSHTQETHTFVSKDIVLTQMCLGHRASVLLSSRLTH